MSVRAVILGLLLGLFVAGVAYYNDAVIGQTMIIGHHFPIGVFGVVLVGVLALNPLLGRAFGRGGLSNVAGPLRPVEVCVIAGIGLAACAWPGSNLYRVSTGITALPAHWLKTEASWKSANVMAYVPGGASTVAEGHVQDWGLVIDGLRAGQAADAGALDQAISAAIPERYALAVSKTTRDNLNRSKRNDLLATLNQGVITFSGSPSAPEPIWKTAKDAGQLPADAAAVVAQIESLQADRAAARSELVVGEDETPGPLTLAVRAAEKAHAPYKDAADALTPPLTAAKEALRDIEAELAAAVVGVSKEAAERTRLDYQSRIEAAQDAVDAAQQQLDAAQAARKPYADALAAAKLDAELAKRRVQMISGRLKSLNERANRLVLVDHWGDALLPPPAGQGLLVTGERADEFVVDTLLTGRPEDARLSLAQLPWEAWWPTIQLWGGTVLLLGFAALCLSLIVHPQWSRRELLTYPVVKFMEEASERDENRWLPKIAYNKLFWIGVLVPVFLHTVNGLHAWHPNLPDIPLTLDFEGLKKLFPNLARQWIANAYFTPTLYLSVIAFAFFLSAKVSFSLGISQLLFVMLGAVLIANGETLDNDYMGAKKSNLLRFGAYFGITLMILYTGRRYYLNAVGSAVGLKRGADTPSYVPWATRLLAVCFVLSVVVLGRGGMSWPVAVMFVLLVLMTFVVMARICAETGLFFNQAVWMPVGVMTALFGADAIGPTTYVVLAVASAMIVGDPREALMPFLTNALKLGDRPEQRATPGRMAPVLGVMIVASFVVAGAVTMHSQYNDGVAADPWAKGALPKMSFKELTSVTKTMSAEGTLAESTAAVGLEKLALALPEKGALPWLAAGLILVIVAAAARLRFPWWPIHPVLFLVWGTYPMVMFAFSFLIGWMVKASVTRLAGAKGYQDTKPLMIGVIAGELFMALVWMLVGALYYFVYGLEPKTYAIFPG